MNGSGHPSAMDFLAKNLAFLLKGGEKVQAPLAEKIGVGQPTVSKWSRLHETGSASEPGFRSMSRLCQALKISMDDLAFSPKILEMWTETFPQAEVTRLAGPGHFLQEDAYERIVAALLEHLEHG